MASDEDRIAKHFSKPGGVQGSTSPRSGGVKLGAGNPKCPKCQKSVYANEKVIAVGKDWHIACLKCTACNKRLDAQHLTEHNGEVFCNGCYNAKFGPKGFGYATGQHTEGGTGEKPINASSENPNNTGAVAANAAGGAKFCPSCGTPTAGANFCASCGNKLA